MNSELETKMLKLQRENEALKQEVLELRNKIANMNNPQVKYVIVENPKTCRRTIMEKIKNFSETYRACPNTIYFGYFKELEHLGEFATAEDAQTILNTLKEE